MTSPIDPGLTGVLWDALDSGLIILDRDLRIAAWNSWMESAAGVPAGTATGRTLTELDFGPGASKLSSAARSALETGASRLLTHTLHPSLLPLKTRAARPLVHNVTVRPIGERPHAHCLIQIVDVTVSAEREAILRERQNARYDAVVQSAPDPILTMDDLGLIQVVNAAAGREFGFGQRRCWAGPWRVSWRIRRPGAWHGTVWSRAVTSIGRLSWWSAARMGH